MRITNYQNPYDRALKLSNVKRLGAKPRIGRVGIPKDAPDSVVNVDVGEHWNKLQGKNNKLSSHSWHFKDETFARDLVMTLSGEFDRNVFSTRVQRNGVLCLA